MQIVLGLASVMLAACFTKPERPTDLDPTGDGPAGSWLEGWEFRKRIEIHPGISGTLANFPIAYARTDADVGAHSRFGGRDLVVTESDGTSKLAIDLVAYDAGAVELWARVPELAEGTTIYLYYGGEDQTPSNATWDGIFQGVWHLSEPATARDSSSFTNHMMSTGSRVPGIMAGMFGGARSLDGVDDALTTNGDPQNGAVDFGTGTFSYSMWVFQDANLGQFDTPFFKGGTSSGEPGYCWILGDSWSAKLHDGIEQSEAGLGTGSQFQDRWVHLVAVIDRGAGELTAYADGAIVDSAQLDVGNLSNDQQLEIGRTDTASGPFAGLIDEVRIYNVALAPDWIRAEHANGLDPNFLDVGSEEPKP